MKSVNGSKMESSNVFFLVGIPGLESSNISISIALSIMYVAAILGNGIMLFLIVMERRLHNPMYYFLSMLCLTDILMSSSVSLKMLSLFWFDHKEIDLVSCLTQMFFVHSSTSLESAVLLVMAFDRYVAICNPLRYTTTLTNTLIKKICMALIIRPTLTVTPCPLMASRLPYCGTHQIPHSYCDHMAVVKLACSDITINSVYGLTATLVLSMVDVAFIAVSYLLILRAVMRLSSRTARTKTLSTCTSHMCVFLMFYTPGLFSLFFYRIGHIAPYIHVIFSNLYVLIPPMFNPLVYGLKTKEIRRAASRLLSG